MGEGLCKIAISMAGHFAGDSIYVGKLAKRETWEKLVIRTMRGCVGGFYTEGRKRLRKQQKGCEERTGDCIRRVDVGGGERIGVVWMLGELKSVFFFFCCAEVCRLKLYVHSTRYSRRIKIDFTYWRNLFRF